MDAMLKLAKESNWRIANSAINFITVILLDRSKLLPIDIFRLLMDKMNDDHPQLRSTVQARFSSYLRLFSNLGFARTYDELMLREWRFPNDVIVRPFEHANFTEKYVEALNSPPSKEYVLSF